MYENIPSYLKEFLNYLLVIQGKSDTTVQGYYYDLRTFLRFVKLHNHLTDDTLFEEIEISDVPIDLIGAISISDLYEYLSFVNRSKNNQAKARARKVSCLRSFFKYLHNKAGLIDSNPTLDLETPKVGKTQPVYLTLEESKKLLSAINSTKSQYWERDLCLIVLFLNCGMRLSEMVGIDIKDIRGDIIVITGKGNKQRTVYLNSACTVAIENYLRVRPNEGLSPADRDALFISRAHKRISATMVEKIVKKYIEIAGLDTEKYSPHKLRHTAATLLYKYGEVDIRILQEILGHENLSTTQIYTHLDNQQLRKAVNKHPLGN